MTKTDLARVGVTTLKRPSTVATTMMGPQRVGPAAQCNKQRKELRKKHCPAVTDHRSNKRLPKAEGRNGSLSRGRPPADSWQDLRGRFLAALDCDDPPAAWRHLWRLLVEHPWYQSQLASCARWVLKSNAAPNQWANDLRHDALLLLACALRRRRDLGFDPHRAENQFAPWLRRIALSHTREALLQTQRQRDREAPLPAQSLSIDQEKEHDLRIDLSLEIERLANPQRTMLSMSLEGYTAKEIAHRLRQSYGGVQCELRRTLGLFAERLRKIGLLAGETGAGAQLKNRRAFPKN